MSAHTPSPWKREGTTVYALQRIGRWEENRFWATVQGKASAEELEADARLIAAAPELLEALERLTSAWRRMGPRTATIDGKPTAVEQAESAIAKARGDK